MTGCEFTAGCKGLGLTPEEMMALTPGASFVAPKPSIWDTLVQQIGSWSQTGQDILKQQNIARGVYTQTGPGGVQTTYVQPEGTQQNIFSAIGSQMGVTGTASAGMGLVVVGGAALLLVFMMARKR